MERGTVVICRIGFTNQVGVVLGISDNRVYRIAVNQRSIELTSDKILSVVGITEDSIQVADEFGRWMS